MNFSLIVNPWKKVSKKNISLTSGSNSYSFNHDDIKNGDWILLKDTNENQANLQSKYLSLDLNEM